MQKCSSQMLLARHSSQWLRFIPATPHAALRLESDRGRRVGKIPDRHPPTTEQNRHLLIAPGGRQTSASVLLSRALCVVQSAVIAKENRANRL